VDAVVRQQGGHAPVCGALVRWFVHSACSCEANLDRHAVHPSLTQAVVDYIEDVGIEVVDAISLGVFRQLFGRPARPGGPAGAMLARLNNQWFVTQWCCRRVCRCRRWRRFRVSKRGPRSGRCCPQHVATTFECSKALGCAPVVPCGVSPSALSVRPPANKTRGVVCVTPSSGLGYNINFAVIAGRMAPLDVEVSRRDGVAMCDRFLRVPRFCGFRGARLGQPKGVPAERALQFAILGLGAGCSVRAARAGSS